VHDFSKIAIRHRKLGWQEKELERGLHMNSYVTEEKLEQIWGAAFDILEVRRYPPRHAHLIGRAKPGLKSRFGQIEAPAWKKAIPSEA